MTTLNSTTNTLAGHFDSLDEKLESAEAICHALAEMFSIEDPTKPAISKASVASLAKQAATLLNVANAEAYSLRLEAVGLAG